VKKEIMKPVRITNQRIFEIIGVFMILLFLTHKSHAQEKKMPSFSLQDLQDNTVSSSDYEGKFLVIHIATTWCPFCNAEAPHLKHLYQEYADLGVEVLIIDVKEPADLVRSALQDRFQLPFPVLLDQDGAVAASFAPDDVLPDLARDEVMLASNILVDPEGNIIYLSLLDTRNFDAKLIHIKKILDEQLDKI
jgi:peroxiredoxin